MIDGFVNKSLPYSGAESGGFVRPRIFHPQTRISQETAPTTRSDFSIMSPRIYRRYRLRHGMRDWIIRTGLLSV